MLVLSRHVGQRIHIGNDVTVTVCKVRHGKVRLGFEAPPDVQIHREEVAKSIARNGRSKADPRPNGDRRQGVTL